jgi:alpha-galactosidase
MWAMLAAPLIAGNDLRKMSKEVKDVLTNKEVIAVNQDPLGIQGFQYTMKDSVQIWLKPLKNEEWAVCFLNRSTSSKRINHNWKAEGIKDTLTGRVLDASINNYSIKDLWTNKVTDTQHPVDVLLAAHDVYMLKLRKQ